MRALPFIRFFASAPIFPATYPSVHTPRVTLRRRCKTPRWHSALYFFHALSVIAFSPSKSLVDLVLPINRKPALARKTTNINMHQFERVGRTHRRVHARQEKDDDDVKSTTGTTDKAAATSVSDTKKATQAATTTSAATKSTKAETTAAATTSTSVTPLIDLSSLLGDTTSKSSTSSSPSTTSSQHTTSSSSSSSTMITTSASSTTPYQQSTLTATRTASDDAATASSTQTSTSQGGLSGAETGGIVAGCILAGLALLIYAVRKTFIQRRKRKRNTWGAGSYPDINDKYSDGVADLPPPLPEKTPSTGHLSPRTPVWAPARPVSPNPTVLPSSSNYYIQPPQPSYNNAVMDAAPMVAPANAAAGVFGGQSAQGETASVRVLYIPTLPDELSITTGEIVHIIKAYDDGWALCSNARGEQGVVPLECLDRTGQNQSNGLFVRNGQHEGGDWRNMKRMSSLSTQ